MRDHDRRIDHLVESVCALATSEGSVRAVFLNGSHVGCGSCP